MATTKSRTAKKKSMWESVPKRVQTASAVLASIIAICTLTDSTQYTFIIEPNTLSSTHTFAQAVTRMRMDFAGLTSGTAYSNSIKVMLEAGSSATTYEPYTGGAPMPNPDFPSDVNVVSGVQLVQITGKNLFNFAEFAEAKTQPGGVNRGTATATGNAITITATAYDAFTTYNFLQGLPPIIKVPKHTDMVLSWVSSNAPNPMKGMIYIFGMNASGTADVIRNAQDQAGKTTFNTGNYDTISLRLGVTAIGDSITYSNIQLEYGTEPTEYEPYKGTQSQELNLGKNIACIETSATKTIGGVPFTIEDGIIKISSGTTTGYTNFYFDSFRVRSGSSSFWMEASGYTPAPSDNCTYVLQESADGGSTWTNIAQMSFASPSTQHPTLDSSKLYRIRIYAPPSVSFNNAQIKFQLEYGPIKTSFSPYFPPIELAKIGTYQDYIWNDDGTWKIHKEIGKVVLDGSENWLVANSGTQSFYYYALDVVSNVAPTIAGGTTSDILMSNLGTPAGVGNNNTVKGIFIIIASGQVRVRYGTEMTAQQWQTFLSGTNMALYYALATPTDTKITDSELVEQLDAILDASLYVGQNNIFLIPSGGAQGEMAGDYRLIYEEETDIIPKTPVVLTLSDGGVINPCGCRQNIQLIMRETKGSE